ncbi:MAG: hypothetical protein IPN42_19215 [Methylococcaceae bacterium]|nr:hypothetical protein [Methylococcaceae bacterium]
MALTKPTNAQLIITNAEFGGTASADNLIDTSVNDIISGGATVLMR